MSDQIIVNDVDGPIVKFTKRTLHNFPKQTVGLYKGMVWQDKIFFFVFFVTTVCLVRALLYLIHTFEIFPLILLFVGMYYILSAFVLLIFEQAANKPAQVDDLDFRDAYYKLTRCAYWLDRHVDGVRQHSRQSSAQFHLEVMTILIVLAIVLPMVSFDAIVWLTVLALLLVPGIVYSWGGHRYDQPQPQAQPIDQPRENPNPQPVEQPVGAAPRRNVPRYNDRSMPALHH